METGGCAKRLRGICFGGSNQNAHVAKKNWKWKNIYEHRSSNHWHGWGLDTRGTIKCINHTKWAASQPIMTFRIGKIFMFIGQKSIYWLALLVVGFKFAYFANVRVRHHCVGVRLSSCARSPCTMCTGKGCEQHQGQFAFTFYETESPKQGAKRGENAE